MSSVNQSFTSASADSGWANPSNALTNDGDYAVSPTLAVGASSYWEGLNPFASNPLPATARIEGITFTPIGRVAMVSIRVVGATLRRGGTQYPGSTIAANSPLFSTNDVGRVVGNSAFLWGLSNLKGADLNDPTFGVRLPFTNSNGSFAQAISLKHVSVTVFYTDASGSAHQQFYWSEL